MSGSPDGAGAPRVISGKLHRVRRGHARAFVERPAAPPPVAHRPARVALMLALAHKIEELIHRGAARDRADVARRLGLTRARVTQLLDLTLLAPEIQEAVLLLEAIDGVEPLSERVLRALAPSSSWAQQREAWRALSAEAPPPAEDRQGIEVTTARDRDALRAVRAHVEVLHGLTREELLRAYTAEFGAAPPSKNRELMIKRISYRLQRRVLLNQKRGGGEESC
jgi:hypothetical protein